MKTLLVLLFFAVLVNVTHSFVNDEIGVVDQNELFRVNHEINPRSKAICTVHKSTGIWQCIMNCGIIIDEDDIQMRQHRFKSCVVARTMIRHMERNPYMAKHINLKFTKNKMVDEFRMENQQNK
ncbi:uncharacterized protein LOC131670258 [Phymastichus coffea]|uniref:uncharacterized protein LOC131670258 n=1 Tax=Phymastichus coffea TaxID=108790 RepID=UPI00273C0208|nr:uncharacterized protein LOC131670258 [Phymastichus coffea]